MSIPGMLLTTADVLERGIVTPADPRGRRSTTVDASIGAIVTKAGVCKESSVVIPPRGIAWIMSEERFHLPKTVTGVTTLKTTWTRRGILTLTVGIVDPGYDGYLGTAVINFGKNDFPLTKGDTFFRTAFFLHDEVEVEERHESEDGYLSSVERDAAQFSESFLTIDNLATEILPKLLGFPQVGIQIAVIALIMSILGLCVPLAWNLSEGMIKWEMSKGQIEAFDERVDDLGDEVAKTTDASEAAIAQLRDVVEALEKRIPPIETRLTPAPGDDSPSAPPSED